MGLDISAYSNLKKLDCLFDQYGEPVNRDGSEIEEYVKVFDYDAFPGRAAGLEDGGIYAYDDALGFRAGAYSGYNRWRDELAKVAGWPLGSYRKYERDWPSYAASAWDAQEGPFWELINFSDCDGTIGPIVSAKLAKDFADFDERAKQEGEFFYQLYQEWRKAFELASKAGCVRFH